MHTTQNSCATPPGSSFFVHAPPGVSLRSTPGYDLVSLQDTGTTISKQTKDGDHSTPGVSLRSTPGYDLVSLQDTGKAIPKQTQDGSQIVAGHGAKRHTGSQNPTLC